MTNHLLPESENNFTWGPVKEIHRIESLHIVIIEYRELSELPNKLFELRNNSNDVSKKYFESLESAIIFGIAKHKSIDDSFALACCKLLSTT